MQPLHYLAADLQTRVNLIRHVVVGPRTPVLASLRYRTWDVVVLDLVRTLDNVDIQASTDVPGDVTVEWPHTSVVGEELHDDVGWCSIRLCLLEDLRVTTIWIAWIGNGAIPSAKAFGEDLIYFM